MLAKHLKIDPVALSHIFKGLKVKGYIRLLTHPTDVKTKVIRLTQEGKELIDQMVNIIADADHKFFNGLNGNAVYFNEHLKKLLEANK